MARLLCDVDSTLNRWANHAFDEIELVLSRPSPKLEELTKGYDIMALLDEEQEELLKIMLSGPTFWATLPVIPGAQEGIRAIEDAAHEVFYVTSPWIDCETWEHERRTWLAMHFGADYKHVIPIHRKELVQGDVFVDDRPDKVKDWLTANPYGAALLYAQPYNEKEGADFARFTWDHPEPLMLALKHL